MGSKRIWNVIRAFNSRNLAKSTQVFNNPNSPELINLQNELSRPDIPPVSIPYADELSRAGLQLLLKIYNNIYKCSEFPDDWKQTKVTFIPKSGGKGFRPIFLTSNLCKLLENMVHFRVEYHAEHHRWLPSCQYGCRKTRSSMDCVAMVTTDVMQAFNGYFSFD